VDALLGGAALGDIGQHFPNTDPRWKGEPSSTFLAHAARLLHEAGWEIVNVDISVLAEAPKVMPRAVEMREAMSKQIGID
ncbi:2-C-methyl-D-erythritol 2,4-cyclodiphosphate synthase, partial [Enterococcus faecalis]|uniref:2-C-methyl-D-erythritol 2,4-cyclodiphosphate synthase n=1 Tax=Enterococcus faecalis TaxID=1351 RepID=UPI00403FB3DF